MPAKRSLPSPPAHHPTRPLHPFLSTRGPLSPLGPAPSERHTLDCIASQAFPARSHSSPNLPPTHTRPEASCLPSPAVLPPERAFHPLAAGPILTARRWPLQPPPDWSLAFCPSGLVLPCAQAPHHHTARGNFLEPPGNGLSGPSAALGRVAHSSIRGATNFARLLSHNWAHLPRVSVSLIRVKQLLAISLKLKSNELSCISPCVSPNTPDIVRF